MKKCILLLLCLCGFALSQPMDIDLFWHAGGWNPVTITDGEFFYQGQNNWLTISREENGKLIQIGARTLDYTPSLIKVFGDIAYVVHDNAVNLFNVSDPARILPTQGFAFDSVDDKIQDITVNNGFIYIAVFNQNTKTGFFRIVDNSNPSNPQFGSVAVVCQSVAVRGTTAFVVTGHSSTGSNLISLTSYNVADISNIQKLDDIQTGGAEHVFILNNMAFTGGAGQGGLIIVDISNPGNLQYLVQNVGSGPIRRVVAKGNFAYAATWTDIITFNISNPQVPNMVDQMDLGNATINILQLDAMNNRLVVVQSGEVKALDISTPSHPEMLETLQEMVIVTSITESDGNLFAADGLRIWRFETTSNNRQSLYLELQCNKLYIHNNLLFVTGRTSGFTIFDISNVDNPVQRGTFETDFTIMAMTFSGDLAFAAAASMNDGDHKVIVIDISDTSQPKQLSQKMLPGAAIDVAVSVNSQINLVVAYYHPDTQASGYVLYDAQNPENLSQLSNIPTPGKPTALWADGPLLLVSSITQEEDGWFLEAYDIQNPVNPARIAETNSAGVNSVIYDIDVCSGTVYAATSTQGLLSFFLQPEETGNKKASINQSSWNFSILTDQFNTLLNNLSQILANPDLQDHHGASNVTTGVQGHGEYGNPLTKGVEGLAKARQPQQQPNPQFFTSLMIRISPVEANKYCSVSPGLGRHTYLRRSTVQLTAFDDPAHGWHFKEWKGAGGGAAAIVVNVFMDVDKDVDAVFQEVSLTVSGRNPKRAMCPAEVLEYNRLQMTPITFCASEADGWTVTKFSIRARGRGHEVDDLRAIYVWAGTTDYFEGQFTQDNGVLDVTLDPVLVLGAGDCITLNISYGFEFDEFFYASDTSQTFAIETFGVAAEPINIKPGLITGQAKCDTLSIARVFNTKGDGFTEIQPAVWSPTTEPGDTCHVCEGIYEESVLVDKSVIIKSIKGRETTIVMGHDSTVFTVTADHASIEGFSLEHLDPRIKKGAGIYVDHANHVKLCENKIDTSLYIGIKSHVAEHLRILDNHLENRLWLDMAFYSKVHGNHFYARPKRAAGSAVFFARVAPDDTVSNNFFHIRSDIFVQGGDQCVINNNELDQSITQSDSRRLIILDGTGRSRVSRNKYFGISLSHDSDNNIIEYNETSGISLSDAHRNTVAHNTVNLDMLVQLGGISVMGDAEGLQNNIYDSNYFSRGNIIEDNEIHGLDGNGIEIKWCDDTTIRRNNIHHNDIHGIHIFIAGKVRIHNNTISRNGCSGINTWMCDEPIIHDNRITWHENTESEDSGYGIMMEDVLRAKVYSNQLLRNCTAVEIDNDRWKMSPNRYNSANNFIGLNVLNDSFCLFTGIHLADSRASIYGNNIQNNQGAGIAMSNGSNPEVWSNNIFGNEDFQVVNNDETVQPDLSGNWWGDAAGPDESAVSGNTLISYWLPEPVSLLVAAEQDTAFTAPGNQDSVWVFIRNLTDLEDRITLTVEDEQGWITPVTAEQSMEDSSGITLAVKYTVPQDVAAGSTNKITINAESIKDGLLNTAAGDSFLILTYAPVLSKLTIMPDSLVLKPGESIQYISLGTDQYGTDFPAQVEWSGTKGQITAQGVFTTDDQQGIVKIEATASETGLTAESYAYVSEQEPVLSSLSISPDYIDLKPGETVLFVLNADDQFGFPYRFPPLWKSGGGTVDASGMYRAGSEEGIFSLSVSDSAETLTAVAEIHINTGMLVRDGWTAPENFTLYQNYPNPFNPVTTIEFYTKEHTRVTLELYNVLGRKVKTLIDGSYPRGLHQVHVEAGQFASGVYFYKIRMGDFTDMKKMLFVK
ncbi:right-handed parallel beta-helix repeat-containing protein [candidate division KSB1 bacterium]|nr:right-handed parallel beta-helix repeat-containing protein [candidate division KSB1 bacterium]